MPKCWTVSLYGQPFSRYMYSTFYNSPLINMLNGKNFSQKISLNKFGRDHPRNMGGFCGVNLVLTFTEDNV